MHSQNVRGQQQRQLLVDAGKKARAAKVTETQLENLVQGLFRKHDSNNNGGIEFGLEFDNFLSDWYPYAKGTTQHVPRDSLRELVKTLDVNQDGVVTFDEFWPLAKREMEKAGRLIRADAIAFSTPRTNNKDAFSSQTSQQSQPLPRSPSPNKSKVTEKQLESISQRLFIKHDENKNGIIEFGREFDALLYETYEIFGEKAAKMPRDQIRSEFNRSDINKDGKISYQEYWNFVYNRFLQDGRLIRNNLQQTGNFGLLDHKISVSEAHTDQNVSGFSCSTIPEGDQMLPGIPKSPSPNKKLTENQFKKQLQSLFVKHDENQSGGIEVGKEFDNFLGDYISLIGQKSNGPRDQLRMNFKELDYGGDEQITYQEILPMAMESADNQGILIPSKKTSQTPQYSRNLTSGKRKSQISMVSQRTDTNEFDESELIMSDQALPEPEEKRIPPTAPQRQPSILELSPKQFSFAIRKIISIADQKKRGYLDGTELGVFKRAFYRWLQQDPKQFTQEAINQHMLSLQKLIQPKLSPKGEISIQDLVQIMQEWAYQNRSNQNLYQVIRTQVSEATFQKDMQNLFRHHDENNSGGIEFGKEFDNYLHDLARVLWPDGSMNHASRDQLRQAFRFQDKDGDKQYQFDEVWELVLQIAKKNGVVVEKMAEIMRKDQPDAIQQAKLAGYGKKDTKKQLVPSDRSDSGIFGEDRSAEEIKKRNESDSELFGEDRSEEEPQPQKILGRSKVQQEQTDSEVFGDDRSDTIRQPMKQTSKSNKSRKTTHYSKSPTRSFKEPLSRQEMRTMLHETLNYGVAPAPDDDSLDQSRDEDIYVLTPSHKQSSTKGRSLSRSRGKSLSRSRKSRSPSPQLAPDVNLKPHTDYNAVRTKFSEGLYRAYKKESMEWGVSTCHEVINENAHDRQIVKLVLQALTQKDLLPAERQDKFYTGAAMHAAMFGYLAKVYKENMINPPDKTREKTYERIINYIIEAFFSHGEDIVSNGCAITMIEVIDNVFPELKDKENEEAPQKLFSVIFIPLLSLLQGGVGTSKTSAKSASFCLRKVVQHLIKNYDHLVGMEIIDGLVQILIRGQVTESDYSEMMRDIIKFFDNDIVSVFDANLLQTLKQNISVINRLTNNSHAGKVRLASSSDGQTRNLSPHKKLGHIPAKQLEDLISAIRLQRTIVDASRAFAKQVFNQHYQSAQEALSPILTGSSNKLGRLQTEAQALQASWNRMRDSASKSQTTKMPGNSGVLPVQNTSTPITIFNKKPSQNLESYQHRREAHKKRIRSSSNQAADLKPYGNPMVTGLVDHKTTAVDRKSITKGRPFAFAKTQVEEVHINPSVSQFLKKGNGSQRPQLDDDIKPRQARRAVSAIHRPKKEDKKVADARVELTPDSDLQRELSPKDELSQMMKEQVASLQQMLMDGFGLIGQKMSDMEGRLNQSETYMRQVSSDVTQQQNRDSFNELQAQIQDQQRQMVHAMKKVGDFQPKRVQSSKSRSPTPKKYPFGQTAASGVSVPKRLPRLTRVWHKATEFVKKRSFEQAYRLVLSEGDDIYLLRLVAQTGPVIKCLQQDTAKAVLSRINKIVRRGVFEAIEVEWIDEAHREGLFSKLCMNEQNEYMDTLYQLSKGDFVSEPVILRSSEVYTNVKQSIFRQNKMIASSLPQTFYPQYMPDAHTGHLPPLLAAHQQQARPNSKTTKFY